MTSLLDRRLESVFERKVHPAMTMSGSLGSRRLGHGRPSGVLAQSMKVEWSDELSPTSIDFGRISFPRRFQPTLSP